MNFQDYKWFNNPRGLRNNGPYTPLDVTRYAAPKMGWAKLAVGGSEHVETAKALLAKSCMPIVQIVRERMGAAPAEEGWFGITRQYFKAGVLWFELYDEPNADHFWPLGKDGQPNPTPDRDNRDGCIAPVMDNWLDWAERIAEMGAYPAFPAMAETTAPAQATVGWIEACLRYLGEEQANRFTRLINSGLWCAVHPYLLNHFYQEPPGGPATSARPFYQQSHKEGGWHFEYPYDPLQQHDDPGRTPMGGTAKSPQGDPNGLVASGEIFTALLKKLFAAGPVPVVGTAGGISPIPAESDRPIQPDTRYYGYSRDSHGEATLAMFRWLAEQGPPWLFGLTLSNEADYYGKGAPSPAIKLMSAEPPAMKQTLDLEIAAGGVPRPVEAVEPQPSPATIAPAPKPPMPVEPPEIMPVPIMPEPVGAMPDEMIEPARPVADEDEVPPPTVLWPPPMQWEEYPGGQAGPAPVAAMPEPILSPAMPAPMLPSEPEPPMDDDVPPPTVLWPAPTQSEEPVIILPAAMHQAAPPPAPAPEPPPAVAAEPALLATGPQTAAPMLPAAPEPPPLLAQTASQPVMTVASMELPPPPSSGEKLGPGPGPVTGLPDDHWLMLAHDLPPAWIGAARRYWDIFRTEIVADPTLISAMPPEKSLAVTLLALGATADSARQRIAAEWPNVQIDVIAAESAAEMQAELDRRARERKEYG